MPVISSSSIILKTCFAIAAVLKHRRQNQRVKLVKCCSGCYTVDSLFAEIALAYPVLRAAAQR